MGYVGKHPPGPNSASHSLVAAAVLGCVPVSVDQAPSHWLTKLAAHTTCPTLCLPYATQMGTFKMRVRRNIDSPEAAAPAPVAVAAAAPAVAMAAMPAAAPAMPYVSMDEPQYESLDEAKVYVTVPKVCVALRTSGQTSGAASLNSVTRGRLAQRSLCWLLHGALGRWGPCQKPPSGTQ